MRRVRIHWLVVVAGAAAVLLPACSSRKHALQRADRYFDDGQYEAAEIEYMNVLQAERTNSHAIVRLGMIYFDQGRVAKSLPFLLAGKRMQPDNLQVRLKLGLYYLAFGKFPEARDEALFILAHDPRHEDAPLLLAQSAVAPKEIEDVRRRLPQLPPGASIEVALGTLDFRQKRFQAAEGHFQKALTIDPNSGAAFTAVGALCWARNDMAGAERAFARAAELAGSHSAKRLQYAQFEAQLGKRDEARRILEETIDKTPDFLPACMLLAELDESEKRYDDSDAAVRKVLDRDPGYPDALLLEGRLLLAKAQPQDAVTVLERALGIYPHYPQLEFELAQAYMAVGSAEKAESSLTQAITSAPDFAEASLALAQLTMNRGDFASAIVSLKQLVARRPDLPQARLLLARAYLGRNEPESALAIYRAVAAAQPADPQTAVLTGITLLQLGRIEEARRSFEAALKLAPNYLPAAEQLVELDLAQKNFPAARRRAEEELAGNPSLAEAQVLRARVFLAEGEMPAAEVALQKAIKLRPDSPTAYFLLAELYFNTKKDKEALIDLQAVVAKNPRDTQALMLIGAIENQQKDYAGSLSAFEKVLAVDPNFSPAVNNLAYLYSENFGQLDKAFDMAQKARKLMPNEPHAADTLGWILYKKRQYSWALSLLQESAGNLSTDPETLFHLGMTQYMMGEAGPARQTLQRALQLGGDFPGADEARRRAAILAIDPATAGSAELTLLEKAAAERGDDPIVPSRLAALYERRGQKDRAIALCQAALRENPKNVAVLTRLARLQSAQGNATAAFTLAKSARDLAPTDPEVAALLGRLAYQMRDYGWSLSLLQEASAKLPNDPECLFDLGQALESVGRTAEAQAATEAALKAGAFARAAEARRFLELTRLSPSPEADRSAQSALEADPANIPALMYLAGIRESERNPAEAKALYEKVLASFPDFVPAEKRLVLLYAAGSDDDKRAAELALRAREALPDDLELARACGVIAFRNGDFRRAADLLSQVADQSPNDAMALYYLGMAQYRQGDKAGKDHLQAALKLDLRSDLATQARQALAGQK